MPKIPLYNQGAGPTVGVAAGQLSPRASAAAFTAPGRALTGYQKTFSDIGQVAQQFALAEKDAQTRQAISDVTVESKKRWEQFNRDNRASTVEEYNQQAADFQSGLEAEFQGKYENYTKSQKAAINQKFNQYSVGFSSEGAQTAFNRNQVIRAEKADEFIEATLETLRGLDENDPRAVYLRSALDEAFLDYETQGLKVSYNKQGVLKDISNSNFITGLNAASTIEDLDRLEQQTEQDVTIDAATKSTRLSSIYTNRTRMEADIQDELFQSSYGVIVASEYSEYTDAAAANLTRAIANGEELTIKQLDGTEQKINFSELKAEKRTVLINAIESKRTQNKDAAKSALFTSLSSMAGDMSISDLNSLEDDVNKSRGMFAGVTDQSVRNTALSIIGRAISEKQPIALASAKQDIGQLTSEIRASKGVMSNEMLESQNSIFANLVDAGLLQDANNFMETVKIASSASQVFNEIQFSSATEQQKKLADLSKKAIDEPSPINDGILAEVTKSIAARDNLIKVDFVDYYNRINPDAPLNPSELIALQESMGIPSADVRVLTNSQVTKFKSDFDGIESYDEKGQFGKDFLAQFGEQQNVVFKHLVETGRLDTVDQLTIARPQSIGINAVRTYNEESNVSEQNKRITDGSSLGQEIEEQIRDIFGDYSSSIIGSFTDGVVDPGLSAGRANHIYAMQNVVRNTAKGYLVSGDKNFETAQQAVEKAFQDVVGDSFVFEKGNNDAAVRFPRELENVSGLMNDVLNFSIDSDVEYLKSVIAFPDTPDGKLEDDYQSEFLRDLIRGGGWRTNTNNNGVYLVDHLGNLVPRKAELVGNAPGQKPDLFVSVPFEDLVELGQYHDSAIKGDLDPEGSRLTKSDRERLVVDRMKLKRFF